MPFSTVLFDLDGTLTDPGEGIVRCIEVALRRVGLPVPEEDRLRACVGPPLQQSFAELGGSPEQIPVLVEAYRERFREAGMFENFGGLAEKGDLLAHIKREAELSVPECALVGDRRFDISAARAHDVYAVGALWGYGSRTELEAAGADRLVADPVEVLGALGEPPGR